MVNEYPKPGLGSSPDVPPLPDQARAFRRRARLIDAAVREIATRGYDDVTVASITARAGVPCDAFYEQFGSKEDALVHAYDVAVAFAAPRIFAAMRATDDWRHAAVAALATYLAILDCDREWSLVCLRETTSAGERVLRAREALRAPIVDALARLPTDPAVRAVGMGAVVAALDAIAVDGLRHRPDQTLVSRQRELARFVLTPFSGGSVPDDIDPPRRPSGRGRGRVEDLIEQDGDAGRALELLVRAAVARRDGPTLWRVIVGLQRRRAGGAAIDERLLDAALEGIRDAWFFGLPDEER